MGLIDHFRDDFEYPDKKKNLKGKEGGNCNRTACQQPGADYYNVSTRAYYCWECALRINRSAINDGYDLFPDHPEIKEWLSENAWRLDI